ncbi:rCG37041 [Rattus norvegicus]|uniref:RCG37041 n=1 Tax=Rattus norvegicus TaxID=10116 RepID=A6HUM2_RAT|nr:rCG37041 [Rattus norvegicus]
MSDLKPHGKVASVEMITYHCWEDEPPLPSILAGESFETATVRNSLWKLSEVRPQGRRRPFQNGLASSVVAATL